VCGVWASGRVAHYVANVARGVTDSTAADGVGAEPFSAGRPYDALVRWLAPAAMAAVLALAIVVLHHELRDFRYHDVRQAIAAIPAGRVSLALLLTAAAYAVLPGYDALALAYVGRRLGAGRIAFASFIAYALSQTLGFPLLTGGWVRARFWSTWGLGAGDITAAVGFAGATFLLGLLLTTGLALLLEPAGTVSMLPLPDMLLRSLGVFFLILVGGYLAWSGVQRAPLRIAGRELRAPRPRLALLQLVVAATDWILAAAVLYVLLPAPAPTFAGFLGVFLLAQFAGLVSHVPGGLGVFDALVVLLLGPHVAAPQVLSALVVYRVAYYLLPFSAGLVMLATAEALAHARPQWPRLREAARHATAVSSHLATRWIPSLLPYVLGAAVFVAGVILLFSGATPSIHGRVAFLDDLLPLGVIELSHFVASVAGTMLMILGWALTRRLDAAFALTAVLLALGMVASLFKGFDWEEALTLGTVLLVLLPSRHAFPRRSALTTVPFSPEWAVAIGCVAGVSVWLGLFSYKHVAFSTELFWQFAAHGDAPRFLRATVGVLVTLGAFGFQRLLRHARVEWHVASLDELARAIRIVRDCPDSMANLALLGDKALLIDEGGTGLLMYGVARRAWIAMGDPLGPPDVRRALAWEFRELADAHGGWAAFYEVGTENLPLYIDMGLGLFKSGEEAIVPLPPFTLEGSGRSGLRRCRRELQKAGASFEVVVAEAVPALIGELRQVSDDWLAAKRTREKRFSLGRFDEAYLARFPVGVVRVGGRVVAFANLWSGAGRAELSPDLMRYSAAAPKRVVEFLFIELMLWARDQGYEAFNLGVAPLAGLEDRRLAPLWNRAGGLLYRRGEPFYGFQGLQQFKDKFDPVWRPRYLAAPRGLGLPRVVAGVTALVSGGLRGAVAK
jgi:phosphatidylglycerol lysyltransferase